LAGFLLQRLLREARLPEWQKIFTEQAETCLGCAILAEAGLIKSFQEVCAVRRGFTLIELLVVIAII